jgi:acyl-coenzyme A synthetase/AMP-(fatty) acid ligase
VYDDLISQRAARWPGLAGVQIAVTDRIPRNQMGKIERLTLRRQSLAWMAATRRR